MTNEGLQIALFIGQVERRVYQKGLSELFGDIDEGQIKRAYETFARAVEGLFARHHLSRA